MLSDYRYSYTRYGWEVTYKGTIIAGCSVNVNMLEAELGIEWQEYHRDCAKQKLHEIINENLSDLD